MSSQIWPTTGTPSDTAGALNGALADVAERSFFAMAEPCERGAFDELAAAVSQWHVSIVSFRGELSGTMSCAIPAALGTQFYDAFTGRADDEPAPTASLMADLIGELANMVCGAWLTRVAQAQPFVLGQPKVVDMPEGWRPWTASSAHEFEVAASIDGQPVIILVRH